MKKLVFILLFLVILVASFLAGSWFSHREGAKSRSAGVRSLQVGEEPENDTSSMPPGTVKITPEKQQAIGVQLGHVEKKSVDADPSSPGAGGCRRDENLSDPCCC